MEVQSQFIEMFGNPLSSIQKNELKKLGDCCQINPRRPSVSISDSDLVSFVPMPAVNEDGYIDGATNEEYGKVKKGFTYFENNDVLFAKITPCMENGKGAIAEALTNGIGMGSTEFHVLRPIDGKSNPYWLLTLTRMPIFREYAAKNMSGTGGQRRVGAAFLENFMIGLPSISEQETFETIYRQADKSKFVGFKSQFIEMMGDLPKNGTLSDYCEMKAGKSIKSDSINSQYNDGLYPCYGGNGLRGYVETYSHDGVYNIIGRQGALCGNITLTKGKFYATEHAIVVRPKTPINEYWLYFALAQMNLNQYARGVAQPGLAVKQLEKLPFGIPSKGKQEKFAAVYQQADKSKLTGYCLICVLNKGISKLIN